MKKSYYKRLLSRYKAEWDEIEQVLGRALGYPAYVDDQKNFPGATSADGVCIGDNVATTVAIEAAGKIYKLRESLRLEQDAHGKTIAHLTGERDSRREAEVTLFEQRADYEAELSRVKLERDTWRQQYKITAQERDEERQKRKEQNSKLHLRYITAIRAVQGMVDEFGAFTVDSRSKAANALRAAYAEIEKYLEHYAPRGPQTAKTGNTWKRGDPQKLEDWLEVGCDVLVSWEWTLKPAMTTGCVVSVGSKYVRLQLDGGDLIVIPICSIQKAVKHGV